MTGALAERIDASLRQPSVQRRKSASLSSVERSALLDELVDQLIAVKRDLKAQNDAWQQMQLQQNARIDAHANVLLRRTVWQRLRWVLVGV